MGWIVDRALQVVWIFDVVLGAVLLQFFALIWLASAGRHPIPWRQLNLRHGLGWSFLVSLLLTAVGHSGPTFDFFQ